MATIYISHAGRQAKEAWALGEFLIQSGHEVLHKDEVFSYGTTESALAESDLVLVLFESQSASELLEIGMALGLRKPTVIVAQKNVVLPIPLNNFLYVRVESFSSLDARYSILKAITHALNFAEEKKQRRASQGPGANRISDPKEISPSDFEKRIANWFKEEGWAVESEKSEQDYDLLVTYEKTGERWIVELKRYGGGAPVAIDSIHRLRDAIFRVGVQGGILVTTSEFTETAREYVRQTGVPILLWRTDDMDQWQFAPSNQMPNHS